MKKRISLKSILIAITAFNMLFAANALAQYKKDSVNGFTAVNTIKAEDLKKQLVELASDKYEGRETGEIGQKKAAQYLAEYYKNLGLKSFGKDYFQKYPISSQKPRDASFIVNGDAYQYLKDFYFFQRFDEQELNASEIIFAGYGIKDSLYSDYDTLRAAYKVLLVFNDEPKKEGNISMLTGTEKPSAWNLNWRMKVETARKMGANCLLIIDENIEDNINKNRHSIDKPLTMLEEEASKPDDRLPFIFVSPKMASRLMGVKDILSYKAQITQTGKSYSFRNPVKANIFINRDKRLLEAENVIAYIPGSEFPEEYIVFSAHYDHLGAHDGKIYYGADDDGSGTVAVLELAEAFITAYKQGNGPKRSVVFINFSGEEKGLLGSEYYSKHPIVPLQKTVCDLNIDMIGRLDENHNNNPNYVYLIGSDKLSSDLHVISERVNQQYLNIQLDYTFNSPSDPNRFYYRSDHYNFAKNNIPVIFYFTGVHEDYHKPTDTVDKIDFLKMEKITRLVFYTGMEVANSRERIRVDKTNDFKSTR